MENQSKPARNERHAADRPNWVLMGLHRDVVGGGSQHEKQAMGSCWSKFSLQERPLWPANIQTLCHKLS
jgi:hypothetical protein